MIRPVTAICMLAAGASGLFLYETKHRSVLLDRQIMAVLKQTDATRERIRSMQDEWALLNEPDRLAELSSKHLGLRTLLPTQFVSAADLGNRLPPADAPGTSYAAAEDAPELPVPAALPVAAPRGGARPASPQAPAAAAPVQVATAAPPRPPAPPRPARAETREEASAAPRPAQAASPSGQAASPARAAAPTVSVAAAPIRTPHPAPAVAEAAAPRATVAQAASPAVPPAAARAPAYQAVQYSPAAYAPSAPVAAQSALGGARPSLPPPVPYGAQPR